MANDNDLRWGFCELSTAPQPQASYLARKIQSRGIVDTLRASFLVAGHSILLVERNDTHNRFLSRYSGVPPLAVEQDSVLTLDNSIQVIELEKCDGKSKIFIDSSPLYQIDGLAEIGATPNKVSRLHITVSSHDPDKRSESVSSSTVDLLELKPRPLLSLFLLGGFVNSKDVKSLDRQPLLSSCLKRQLIGCPIVFENSKVTTQISLPLFGKTMRLQVTSVLLHPGISKPTILFVVLPNTKITILEKEADSLTNPTENIIEADETNIGLSPVACRLVGTIRCIRFCKGVNLSRSLLLMGPPGVGKTHAVRLAFQVSQKEGPTKLVSIWGSELLGIGHEAEAAQSLERHFLQAVQWAQSSRHRIVIVFLDECDALVSSEAMAAMLAVMLDRVSGEMPSGPWQRLVVVAATNRLDSVPSYLRRPGRLDQELMMSPPNAQERLKLLNELLYHTSEAAATDSSRTDLSTGQNATGSSRYGEREQVSLVADACVGYVASDLAALARRAALWAVQEGSTIVKANNLQKAMADVGASALRDAALSAPPKIGWDDVAGDPGGAKTALRQAVEWPRTRRASYLRLGLSPPRGILLHGPPGCAKTTLARAAAGATGIAFLSHSPADVYASSYVGDAEAMIRSAFSLARSAAPCILFFDEIDAILGVSGGDVGGMHQRGSSSAEARVLSTFLNEMDGIDGSLDDGVLVLAATNRPWTLDAALLRSGRLGKVIFVPPPDLKGRKSILKLLHPRRFAQTSSSSSSLKENKYADYGEEDIDFDYLASPEISDFMTGAEIVGASRDAATQVLQNYMKHGTLPVVSQLQLEASLRAVKPLLSNQSVRNEYKKFSTGAGKSL